MLHPLLLRQLRRCGIEDPARLPDAELWKLFLEKISRAYHDADEERYLHERSLSISSEEMMELNHSLRASESKLSAERDKLRAIFESVGDGLCVVDRDGKCVSLNAAAERLLGLDEEEARGTPILDAFAGIVPTDTTFLLGRRVDDGTLRRRDGAVLPVAYAMTPIATEGRAQRAVLVFRDISERKHVQARLERERLLLLEVIRNAPVAMAMFDRQMQYVAHSEQWLTDFGLVGQDIVGKCHYDVLPDLPQRFRECHQRGLAGEVLSNPEEEFRRSDGSRMFTRWAIQPFHGAHGEVCGIIMVFARIDDLVEARQAALEMARLKAEFLANVSHEVRTPMNGVLGMAELLGQMDLTQDQLECVRTIETSSAHLLTIVNDLLDFSKIEAGKLRIESVEFRLREVIDNVLRSLSPGAAGRRLRLASAIEGSVPETVLGDPGRLHQVLTNLVGNAIKFTDAGGVTISVHAAPGRGGSPHLRFDVRDTGIGISAEMQRRLFQAFTQGDGSSSRRHGGTGLGLAICRQLVELMGGRIGVESEPGKGSSFWFELPLCVPTDPSGEAFPAAPLPFRTSGSEASAGPNRAQLLRPDLSILLAEDHPVNQRVASRMLAHLGCRVDLAADGRQALDLFRNGRYDCVLMDCQMPELDGYEAVAEIRKREAGTGFRVPIVALTAHAMAGDRDRCLAADMDDYITKPFTIDDLSRVLFRWCAAPPSQENADSLA